MTAPFPPAARRLLVTGAAGFLGQGLLRALSRPGALSALEAVVAVDIRHLPADLRPPCAG